ncbi:hypothetical protein [Jeotgalibacillus aurantiacus]|uniref:hypothetical protein n=1 Tax=Jeotgalibacillus aurantiacus TaxID=2763266 RepID=UPI001D09F0F2|nr:hypothetical protein [Jeotgalibacillus aurantiacus]
MLSYVRWILFAFISLILFGVICLESVNHPPSITVHAGLESAVPISGSYCWEGLISAECVTADPSLGTEPAKASYRMTVEPGEEIHINQKQANSFSVEQFAEDKTYKSMVLDSSTFKAPDQPGTYQYRMAGYWEKGSASYLFTIQVLP